MAPSVQAGACLEAPSECPANAGATISRPLATRQHISIVAYADGCETTSS